MTKTQINNWLREIKNEAERLEGYEKNYDLSTEKYLCIVERISSGLGDGIRSGKITDTTQAKAIELISLYETDRLEDYAKMIKAKRLIKECEEKLKLYCEKQTITKDEYNVLNDYYCKGRPMMQVANTYNYSESRMWQLRCEAVDKIAESEEI